MKLMTSEEMRMASVEVRVRPAGWLERSLGKQCAFCPPAEESEAEYAVEVGHADNFGGPTERNGATVYACRACVQARTM